MFHAGDRDAPVALRPPFGLCVVVSFLITVVYWVVIVPLSHRTGEKTQRTGEV